MATMILSEDLETLVAAPAENFCPFIKDKCPVYDTKGAVQECVHEVEYMGLLDCPEGA